MKITKLWILAFAISLNIAYAQKNDENTAKLSKLTGPYLGQKPPGLTPEPFAPGIVSTDDWQVNGVFTPDMKEFYFVTKGGKYEKQHLLFLKM